MCGGDLTYAWRIPIGRPGLFMAMAFVIVSSVPCAVRTSKDAIFSFSWGGVQRMRRRQPSTLRWFKGTAPHGGIKRRSAAWARCSALLLLLL